MLTMMETCLRSGRRTLRKWALDPKVQSGAKVMAWGSGGFFLSAAGLGGGLQPLALGLVTVLTGWRAVVTALGAGLGYRLFWGSGGILGTV